MPYVPPPPGSTTPGQPTPEGVAKQDVHIADLPPEVRKSFLLSMVFFPTLVGAMICAVMFLAYWTVFKPKEPAQFAADLTSGDARRRWTAARELAESIPPADPRVEAGNQKIYDPVVLTALIQILEDKELDREVDAWTPADMIKQGEEKSKLRWWAAPMVGHFAAKLPAPADKTRGREALLKALEEKELAFFAARGLTLLKDPAAREPLAKHLAENPDDYVKAAVANALGAIGEYAMHNQAATEEIETYRKPLRAAYNASDNPTVLDNVAIALARLGDPLGRARLDQMAASVDPVLRDHAARALKLLSQSAVAAGQDPDK